MDALVENLKTEEKQEQEYYAKYRFRATTPPDTTYLPLYDQLLQKEDQRRRFLKRNAQEMLKSLVNPFQFHNSSLRYRITVYCGRIS